MKPKTKNGIVVSAVVLVIAAVVYFSIKKKELSKIDKVKAIVESPMTSIMRTGGRTYDEMVSSYMKLGDKYISAWYDALQRKAATFINPENGITCSTETGRSI